MPDPKVPLRLVDTGAYVSVSILDARECFETSRLFLNLKFGTLIERPSRFGVTVGPY